MTKSADVLLKLLNKVPDTDTLEILLEPQNLLLLMHRSGRNVSEVRQTLKNGTLPGELLLQLFEEGADADTLIAQLGDPNADTQASNFPPVSFFNTMPSTSGEAVLKHKNAAALVATPDSGNNLFGDHAGTILFLIAVFAVILPATAMTNFLPIGKPTPLIATLIAVLCGAFGEAVSYPMKLFSPKGTLVGIVFGIGTLWTTIAYLQLRDSIFNIELLIPMLIGAIPALIVYIVLYGKLPELK